MKAICDAIYAKFKEASDLYTAIGDKLYFVRAPQEASFPYVVYNIITGNPDDTMSEHGEVLTVQFNIYTNDEAETNLLTYYNYLDSKFNECALTVTGYTHYYMLRTFYYPVYDDEARVWMYVVEYELRIDKAR